MDCDPQSAKSVLHRHPMGREHPTCKLAGFKSTYTNWILHIVLKSKMIRFGFCSLKSLTTRRRIGSLRAVSNSIFVGYSIFNGMVKLHTPCILQAHWRRNIWRNIYCENWHHPKSHKYHHFSVVAKFRYGRLLPIVKSKMNEKVDSSICVVTLDFEKNVMRFQSEYYGIFRWAKMSKHSSITWNEMIFQREKNGSFYISIL